MALLTIPVTTNLAVRSDHGQMGGMGQVHGGSWSSRSPKPLVSLPARWGIVGAGRAVRLPLWALACGLTGQLPLGLSSPDIHILDVICIKLSVVNLCVVYLRVCESVCKLVLLFLFLTISFSVTRLNFPTVKMSQLWFFPLHSACMRQSPPRSQPTCCDYTSTLGCSLFSSL